MFFLKHIFMRLRS